MSFCLSDIRFSVKLVFRIYTFRLAVIFISVLYLFDFHVEFNFLVYIAIYGFDYNFGFCVFSILYFDSFLLASISTCFSIVDSTLLLVINKHLCLCEFVLCLFLAILRLSDVFSFVLGVVYRLGLK